MTWKEPTALTPPAGKYIIRTRSVFPEMRHSSKTNVLECAVSYSTDKKGKVHQHWACNNQKVIVWLDESET